MTWRSRRVMRAWPSANATRCVRIPQVGRVSNSTDRLSFLLYSGSVLHFHVSSRRASIWLPFVLGALVPSAWAGQTRPPDATGDLSKLSLEDLMQVPIDRVYGASKYEQTVTRAPASVTIITADDIDRFGYRNLADVLRSVPGLYVTDDRNYSFLGFR